MNESWDYIIVGGGSVGCVLANRLSADPARRVLLLEAGGDNRNFLVSMPKGFARTIGDPSYDWSYPLEPYEGGPDGPIFWPAGKGLGGGSAINGQLYVRGQPSDYDNWARIAGEEWSWAKMREAFRAIENHELGDDGIRGVGGPVGISINRMRDELGERLIEAGVQMGVPRREDLNGDEPEGVGYYSQNIWRGQRVSAAKAFLEPVRNRSNLMIVTGAAVDRIGFEGGRAVEVHATLNGKPARFRSRGEIIVSCGTMGSPLVLQRSGIGPAELLAKHGIPLAKDLPVGRRLREQLAVVFVRRLTGLKGHNHRLRGMGMVSSFLSYALFRRGVLSNCVWDVGLFARSSPDRECADLQFEIGGMAIGTSTNSRGMTRMGVLPFPALTIYGYMNQLDSEGVVEITSRRAEDAPRIVPNFLSTDSDRRTAIKLMHLVRQYFEQPALRDVIGEELEPGGGTQDDELLATVLRKAIAGVHATGTCAMGADHEGVVDQRLRVHGVAGLRVADCSVMPGLISGNTNGSAMALGWRASDLILEDAPRS